MTKKKKIGIVTTHHEPNYGNKLQNYALQTILCGMGFDVEVINDARSWPDLTSWWAQKKYLFHAIIPFRRQPWHIKYAKFFWWSKKYIHYSKINIKKDKDIIGLANKYDYFVVGSDQIWNPEVPIFSNDFGFATFARKEQKIAYAPSLAISIMPKEREEDYKRYLQNWKALSCREDDGASILGRFTTMPIPVVVDPTLLLTAEQWSKLASNHKIPYKYLVLYTIGELKEEYQSYVNRIAKERNLCIINLNEGKYKGSGPSEFLRIMQDASLMVTDSFHGSVFALQFHVPLVVYKRIEQGRHDQLSRIRTLFRHAGIEPREFAQTINEYFDINWIKVDQCLQKSRNDSLKYLTTNLQ